MTASRSSFVSPGKNRPSIVTPQNAQLTQKAIINRLQKLITRKYRSCLCKGFKTDYARILSLFGRFQREVTQACPYTLACKKGCGVCCYHYAEDVYSFEGNILAEFIRLKRKTEIPTILKILDGDALWRERIQSAVTESMKNSHYTKALGDSDPYDIVLSAFYQLKRPCPLLDENGSCSVYAIRPLACRIYVSFSHPKYCKPENINEGNTATYLLDLEKDSSDLFDELHFMYDQCEGDTGLRSMLLKQLRTPATRYFITRRERT
jgi:Fe-S-cluster containining protein